MSDIDYYRMKRNDLTELRALVRAEREANASLWDQTKHCARLHSEQLAVNERLAFAKTRLEELAKMNLAAANLTDDFLNQRDPDYGPEPEVSES